MNSNSSQAKVPRKLRDRFREETNRAVLVAAEHVFADEGLHAASMSQIAERAGVAVGTLYNHFEDRDALLDAVLDQRRAELLGKLDHARAELAHEPFRKQLEGFLRTLFDHFERHSAFLRVVLSNEYGGQHSSEKMPRALHQRIEGLLKVGHREKTLRPDPDHHFPVMLLGAVRATFLRPKYGAPEVLAASAVEHIADFFLRGAARR